LCRIKTLIVLREPAQLVIGNRRPLKVPDFLFKGHRRAIPVLCDIEPTLSLGDPAQLMVGDSQLMPPALRHRIHCLDRVNNLLIAALSFTEMPKPEFSFELDAHKENPQASRRSIEYGGSPVGGLGGRTHTAGPRAGLHV